MKVGKVRPAATVSGPVRKIVLVLGGVVMLLAFSLGSAEATTTFTVNETGDAADADITDDRCDSDAAATGKQCTLRAAIEEANDTSGADDIGFDLGGSGGQAISPASALPPITDTLIIDGYTQEGASPNTLDEGNDAVLNVILGGLSAGVGSTGLVIGASDCTIKGLLIRNFDGYGIAITGSGATGNHIEGNFIGVNRDGATDKGNRSGVYISGESNTIGGTSAGARNVVSGNDGDGVAVYADDNTVEGNYIGTTADGTEALGNVGHGLYVGGDNNTVGGTTAGARNVVSGNDGDGVRVSLSTSETRIEGNFIGTTADGTGDLGNASSGTYIAGGDNNTVGGTVAGAGNVISGNDADGVLMFGSGTTDNRVEGNLIGTTANGTGTLGNTESGVDINGNASDNTIGGTQPGAANRIARNGADGVQIVGPIASNSILTNRIYRNAGLGIDLVGGTEGASGVTPNDPGDTDTGSNDLQNFPVIRSATKSTATGKTTISGRLDSLPDTDFTIQCFLTDGAPASGYGEGARLLGTLDVRTSSTGSARFSYVSSSPLIGQVPGLTVSVTATNLSSGDTSEFSKNKTILNGP